MKLAIYLKKNMDFTSLPRKAAEKQSQISKLKWGIIIAQIRCFVFTGDF